MSLARHAHEGDGDHVHELSADARGRLVESIRKLENVELTTVGIDIGSSTSHLMFAGVRLQRKAQALSSEFVVVERKVLWKSPIRLTPFAADGTIDAAALGRFVRECHAASGLAPDAVDTGAVILTGEAIKRSNARAIADLFADAAGRFVCASAGHHLECTLAAHGSGAVALSRTLGGAVLNVDIGGGTTKLALAEGGRVLSTAAFAVGGRLLAFAPDGSLARIDEPARRVAEMIDVDLPRNVERVVDAMAGTVVDMVCGRVTDLGRALLVTEPPAALATPLAITFSGGVAEYLYGREERDFADIAPLLARRLRAAIDAGALPAPVREPAEGIRATVIGASQFTVQVSGKTIHVGEASVLPLRNVPVVAPRLALGAAIDAGAVAHAVSHALERATLDEDGAVGIALRWQGEPLHARLRALAEGLAVALAPRAGNAAPVVLLVDGDVARTLGAILERELHFPRALVAIDGVRLGELDFVDVGAVVRPADVVPVVVKSLLFPGGAQPAPSVHYQPVNLPRRMPQ